MNQSKQFKKLQSKWYSKLAKEGFEDIEYGENLKQFVTSRLARGSNNGLPHSQIALMNDSKQEYYRLAGFFLHDYEFPNPIDQLIWIEHSKGISYRDISLHLKSLGIKCGPTKTQLILNGMIDKMLKLYRGQNEQE